MPINEDDDDSLGDHQLGINNAGSYYMRRFGNAAAPKDEEESDIEDSDLPEENEESKEQMPPQSDRHSKGFS